MSLIRSSVRTQMDNEKVADYLRTKVGKNHSEIKSIVVQSDGLVGEITLGEYHIYPAQTRRTTFDRGLIS
jgi:hypothetical protein